MMSVTYRALLVPSLLNSRRKRRIFACMSAMTRRVPQMYVLCASPAVSDRCCESASPCMQAGAAVSDKVLRQRTSRACTNTSLVLPQFEPEPLSAAACKFPGLSHGGKPCSSAGI